MSFRGLLHEHRILFLSGRMVTGGELQKDVQIAYRPTTIHDLRAELESRGVHGQGLHFIFVDYEHV